MPNEFTRQYFFAQGVLQGLTDAADEAGGRVGRVMIAAYFILTGRPREAEIWLGRSGESITVADLERDLQRWNDVFAREPRGTTARQSYERGRAAAQRLATLIAERYGAALVTR
jgi:hypothetical protein